jgi:hypothetical protein
MVLGTSPLRLFPASAADLRLGQKKVRTGVVRAIVFWT